MIRDDPAARSAPRVLFVTHDMGVHAYLTDRLGIMYAGRLVEEAPTPQIFARPLHPYTAHLIASLPRIGDDSAARASKARRRTSPIRRPGCRFHPRCPLAMERCRRGAAALVEVAPQHRVACFAVTDGAARHERAPRTRRGRARPSPRRPVLAQAGRGREGRQLPHRCRAGRRSSRSSASRAAARRRSPG